MKIEIYALSDQAVSLYLEQKIDVKTNETILDMVKWIKKNPFIGFKEAVPAYASLTVFYDVLEVKKNCSEMHSAYSFVVSYLKSIPSKLLNEKGTDFKIIEIPVIYNGEDLNYLSEKLKLSIPEIIQFHTEPIYRVYMLGFLPGFPYLGGLIDRISFPRKSRPRLKVAKGSVGIAGNQTGIYPIDSPGGWQIIGNTKVNLFDLNRNDSTLLKPGDFVKFVQE
jgi:inhibitor of KinA